MGPKRPTHATEVDSDPTAKSAFNRPGYTTVYHTQASSFSPMMDPQLLIPEFLSYNNLGSALSVDFSVMILTHLAHILPPPSLTGFPGHDVGCRSVHLMLLYESSMMTGYSTN